MRWPLMTQEEIHGFGIEVILPYIQKEGVTIESVNLDPKKNPQIVGRRWNSRAFVAVRTACYPNKGELSQHECVQIIGWAVQHDATAFFASVGIACIAYPDKSPVHNEADMSLPIRHAGFNVAYEGLVILNTSDRVRVLKDEE